MTSRLHEVLLVAILNLGDRPANLVPAILLTLMQLPAFQFSQFKLLLHYLFQFLTMTCLFHFIEEKKAKIACSVKIKSNYQAVFLR